ncbi:MAG: ArsR/SmtB family transcription factor [Prosthecobacter sp.]|uniref:ArsR/SmtB family transcription factor n=1 Tax=Prosthecobacter sp. TaxID=1965333 RepID=UPI0038FF1557
MPRKSPTTRNRKTATPNPLPDSALEMIAHRFRALSEPVRLRLLSTLMDGEKNVTQLVAAAGTGQANVSKHLSILKHAGMIATRRDGLNTLCSIADLSIHQLCEIMCAKLKTEHAERMRALG